MELFELDINALSKGKKAEIVVDMLPRYFPLGRRQQKILYKKYSISCTKNARYSIIFLHYNHTYILLLKIVV